MNLFRNMLIRRRLGAWHFRTERIVYIDSQHQYVHTIGIERTVEGKEEGTIERILVEKPRSYDYTSLVDDIQAKRVEILTKDPFVRKLLPTDPFYQKHQALRDKHWNLIRDIVHVNGQPNPDLFESNQYNKLLSSGVRKEGPSRTTIYRLVTQFFQFGMNEDALFPFYDQSGVSDKPRNFTRRPGAPSILNPTDRPGVILTSEDHAKFELGINRFWLTRGQNKQKSLPEVYDRIVRTFYHHGHEFKDGVWIPQLPPVTEYPTFDQFEHWYNKNRSRLVEVWRRYGKRYYNTKVRPLDKKETDRAFGPGHIVMFDATVADVYLVSRFDRSIIIGRPVIYVAIDVYSWMIVGLVVLLEGPSYVGAMTLLANIAADKVSFCQQYKEFYVPTITEEDWPWHYLPLSVLVDRGEMRGKNADRFVDGLFIRVTNTAPWRPDWKGMIERMFRLLNDEVIHHAPGTTYSLEGRIGSDYIWDAKLTLDEFTALIVLAVLDHNRNFVIADYPLTPEMVEARISATPLELFNYGFAHHSGTLAIEDPDFLRLKIMPKGKGTISRDGIRFNGLLYTCQRARDEGWFARVRGQRSQKSYDALHDPRLVDTIYLRLEDGTLEQCELKDQYRHYCGLSFREVEEIRIELGRREYVRQSQRNQSDAEYKTREEQLLKDATKRTNKEIGEANKHAVETTGRQLGKQGRRSRTGFRMDRQHHRQQTAFVPPATPQSQPVSPRIDDEEARFEQELRNQELERIRLKGEEV